VLLIALVAPAQAASVRSGRHEFALTVGYGENHRIPTCMKERFRFDDTTFRWGRFYSDRNEKAYELAFNNQIAGGHNQAIMAVATKRHYFAVRGNTALAYDLAFGLVRFQDAIEGLATRVNFVEQVGLVAQYKVGPNRALSIQYRFSHCSNGGIAKPNVGVNASSLSVGWSWFVGS